MAKDLGRSPVVFKIPWVRVSTTRLPSRFRRAKSLLVPDSMKRNRVEGLRLHPGGVLLQLPAHSGGSVHWGIVLVHKPVSCHHGDTFPIEQAHKWYTVALISGGGEIVKIHRSPFCNLLCIFVPFYPIVIFAPSLALFSYMNILLLFRSLLTQQLSSLGRWSKRSRYRSGSMLELRGEDTYNPDDVNIWRYVARRGFVNKIIFKE